MSKALMKSLDLDLPALAQILRSKGRKGDTILAHITPKEAALLKRRGGKGTKNPATGLPEFYDGEYDFGGAQGGSSDLYSFGGESSFGGASYEDPFQAATNVYAPPIEPTAPDFSQVDTSQQVQSTGMGDPSGQVFPGESTQQGASYEGDAPVPPISAPAAPAAAPATKDSGFNLNNLLSALGGVGGLARMGAGAGTAALGAQAAQKAAQQGQAVVDQIQALAPQTQARGVAAANQLGSITQPGPAGFGTGVAGKVRELAAPLTASITAAGAPLKTAGTELMSQAQSGALTPGQLVALRALQAQNQQGIANRGGVGAQQAGASESAFIADQLQKDYQQGLQEYTQGAQYDVAAANFQRAVDNYAAQLEVTGINTALTEANLSDGYVINALNVGLQNDRLLAQSLQQFYSQVAQATFGSSAMLQQPKYNTSTGQLIQRYDPNTGEALA
jgi:hypothetical protein